MRRRKTLPLRHILVTDWGEVAAPKELIELHAAAPKMSVWCRDEQNELYPVRTIDTRKPEGLAYRKREREYIEAVNLLLSAGYQITLEKAK